MKKLLLTLMLIPIIIAACFHTQIKQWIIPEETISKYVSLQIISSNDYQNKIYAHSTAKLNITVIKLKGNKTDTLMVKDYPELKLSRLPSYFKGFNQVIHIPDVIDKKEQIIFLYKIIYKSKESLLEIQNMNWVHKGTQENKISINI